MAMHRVSSGNRARLLLALLLACLGVGGATAAALDSVRARAGDDPRWASPTYVDSRWPSRSLRELDSQNRILWLRREIDRPRTREPLAVSISALGAYQIFWNGRLVGSSGSPGSTRASERPGKVDGHFAIPPTLVQDRNLLAVRISTFHLPYRMAQPIQRLAVTSYEAGVTARLRNYLAAIACAGLLALGGCYFAGLYVADRTRRDALLLALLSSTLLAQLALEVLRGFVSYRYDLHLLRVGGVFMLAALSGLLLVEYVRRRFLEQAGRWPLGLAAAWVAVCALTFTGFDNKAALALLGSAAIAACIIAPRAARDDRAATGGLIAFALLVAAYIVDFSAFLDRDIYVIACGLLAAALVHHSRHKADRAGDLPREVPSALQGGRLPVLAAKGLELVDIADIAAIHGADDYAEIATVTGSRRLYRGGLSDLVSRLPGNFVRVHRSHVVNVDHVSELISVNGSLKVRVAPDLLVPVSRSYRGAVRNHFSLTAPQQLAPAAVQP